MSGAARWTDADLQRVLASRLTEPPKANKFKNVKVSVDGYLFDSKHEAQHWQELKLRVRAGEITQLDRQVRFPLFTVSGDGLKMMVCEYVADFTYLEKGVRVVEDCKGHLTAEYKLKRKWLALQEGIEIREVYKR